jgi:ABC-type bacteriocin/lantibiotic exporter with double-glycine peptidase domain
MGECLEFDDILQLVLMTLAATVIGMILPSVTKIMTGYVAESDNVNLLAGTSIFMVCAGISSQIMSACRALMMSRVQTKISVSVEASVMMRIMNLPASFFRMFSSGELASRFSAVKQLCTLLIGTVLSASLTSATSLLYVGQIFRFARSLVVPALLILAATLVLSTVTTLIQTKINPDADKDQP